MLPAPRPIDAQRPVHLLVMGGSLGAQALNERVPLALARLPAGDRPRCVIRPAGARPTSRMRPMRTAAVVAEVSEFVDDMAAAYQWADLVICRAGRADGI